MICVNSRFLTQNLTGTQRFAWEVCRKLSKYKNEVIFLSPSRGIIHEEYANLLNIKKFGIFTGFLWEQIELPLFLYWNSCSLLINLINPAPLIYKNQIVTIHDLAFIKFPESFSKLYYYYYRFMIPKIIKNSKKVITVSKFSKNEILSKYFVHPDKILIVHNGISTSFTQNENNININKYDKYIHVVSSFDKRKNIVSVIQAFLKVGITDLKLLIVGTKNRVFSNIKLHNQDRNIIYTGFVSDQELVQIYKNSKGFIYPSLYEGFGLPPLEAQALGCPCIISDIPPHKEIYGNSVLYCNPDNIDGIVVKIRSLLSDEWLRKSLIIKGKQNVKKYNWDKNFKKFLKIINSV